jgi:hypothetical protein
LMSALFAFFIGLTQRSITRGAFTGAVGAGIATALGAAVAAPSFWIMAVLFGAAVGGLGNYFARRSWGSAWTPRGSRHEPWPRDNMFYGGGGSGGFGGGGFSGGFGGGGFSGGGGGFGGGGASGGW